VSPKACTIPTGVATKVSHKNELKDNTGNSVAKAEWVQLGPRVMQGLDLVSGLGNLAGDDLNLKGKLELIFEQVVKVEVVEAI
jgi:hypothetical protein